MSVLFCDLVGFTTASEAADPEDVRARIRPYHARLRLEIERYGGTVEKFIGDAVMAVFGAPIAHEDDAERAIRAGLRILEAIAELNEADPALSLQVRIGIGTGEAVVALGARPEEGEGIVTGDVVNTASRLQGAAPVNGVACSEGTYRQTERVFDYEELEPVAVKGKQERVALFRPLRPRARFGSDVTRKHTTALVGRELEKTLLVGTLERSAQQRSCQLVTIIGEPGVGKSRLCAELFQHIDQHPELVTLAPGPLSALRRGDRLLGARGDRQGGVRHPRVRFSRGSRRQARACSSGGRAGPGLADRAAGPARGCAGGACLAGGVVHGLAAFPGGVGVTGLDGARVRGPALGRRCLAVVPRASRRLVAGRAAARAVCGASGIAGAASNLGGRAAQRDDHQPRPADRGGDRAADRLAARACGAAGGDAAGAAGAGGRQPPFRGGVRAPAGRPRAGGRGGAGLRSGADCRPAGHPLAGAQEPASGRRRGRQGVLGRCPGRDGRT